MRTLHLVALLLLAITGVQLVVYVTLLRGGGRGGNGGRDGDDLEAVEAANRHYSPNILMGGGPHNIGPSNSDLASEASLQDDAAEAADTGCGGAAGPAGDTASGPPAADPQRQSIGLRVVGNIAKIYAMLGGIEHQHPAVPDAAMLLRADGRYYPNGNKKAGLATSLPSPSEAKASAAEVAQRPHVRREEPHTPTQHQHQQQRREEDGPDHQRQQQHHQLQQDRPAEEQPHQVPHQWQEVPNAHHQAAPNRYPHQRRGPHAAADSGSAAGSADFAPAIGDIFEREGREVEARLAADPSLADSLIVVSEPTRLGRLAEAAVVILGHSRPEYLARAMDAVVAASLGDSIKKYVSIDGDHRATIAVAKSAGKGSFELLQHMRDGATDEAFPAFAALRKSGAEVKGTMFVARHYKLALDALFKGRGHSHVIILEDDIVVTRDFFQMFESLAPLLDVDPTLWCISSWNDNGFQNFDLPRNEFFRTSYFPGLGWMLTKEVWEGLSDRFPVDNWDHWMRVATTSERRDCVVPWVSRNTNIGASGTTADAEFYQLYIQPIVSMDTPPLGAPHAYGGGQPRGGGGDSSKRFVPYGDLAYLLSPRYYASFRRKLLDGATSPTRRVALASDMLPLAPHSYHRGHTYAIGYTEGDFEGAAGQLMIRSTPRAMYRHTLWLRYNGADVFLVNRRLSPFADASFRIRRDPSLVAVVAPNYGDNCRSVCAAYGDVRGAFGCDADQFAFINDCKVMARLAPQQCSAHCTQAWGEDVPNMESPFLAKGEGRPAMCVESEMAPTCDASHALTKRFCPCTRSASEHGRRGGGGGGGWGAELHHNAYQPPPHHAGGGGGGDGVYHQPDPQWARYNANGGGDDGEYRREHDGNNADRHDGDASSLALVPSERAAMSCHQVCQSYKGGPNSPYAAKGWRCAEGHFGAANQCAALQKYFPCTECYQSRGADLPNYVSNRDDGQYGRCLLTEEDMGCGGSHRNTQRLCPCLPEL